MYWLLGRNSAEKKSNLRCAAMEFYKKSNIKMPSNINVRNMNVCLVVEDIQ